MTAPPSHVDLLSMARDVRRAAVSDDMEGVRAALSRFLAALTRHLEGEQEDLDALPGTASVIAHEGQRRLLRHLNDVIAGMTSNAESCNCLVRTAQIEAALRRQARLETNLLRRHPGAPSRPGGRDG